MFAFTIPLVLCLSLASGRDYRLRTPPSVSHSIVNLGKMELNVYLNSKSSVADSPKNENEMMTHQLKPLHNLNQLNLQSDSEECRCQQNRRKAINQDMYGPSDLLSRILMNNDLFSFKDQMPVSSSLCCGSHEQIQEEFYMEFNPKTAPQPPPMRQEFTMPHIAPMVSDLTFQAMPMDKLYPKPMQYLPLLLDSLYSNKAQKPKQKTVEIFLFPTKKPVAKPVPTKRMPVASEIQAVGDKKTTMVYDLISANSSVKKDLNQNIQEHLKDMDAIVKTTNTIQNNTL